MGKRRQKGHSTTLSFCLFVQDKTTKRQAKTTKGQSKTKCVEVRPGAQQEKTQPHRGKCMCLRCRLPVCRRPKRKWTEARRIACTSWPTNGPAHRGHTRSAIPRISSNEWHNSRHRTPSASSLLQPSRAAVISRRPSMTAWPIIVPCREGVVSGSTPRFLRSSGWCQM